MKVLYCVSEVAPIIKVGGLGDVAGSLPKVLQRLGVDVKIVVPKYEEIKINQEPSTKNLEQEYKKIDKIQVEFNGKGEEVVVWETTLPGTRVPAYLLENDHYLSKGSHQAFAGTDQEIERFLFFSKSIVQLITHNPQLILQPDLLHLNDWHTSLAPLFLASQGLQHIPSLLTIHNLLYQGLATPSSFIKTGLQPENSGDINILRQGIIHADFINTVSSTYAQEIKTAEFGLGLEDVLKAKESRVTGILNGIDYDIWSPETDEYISRKYKVESIKAGKTENKKFLQQSLGLEVNQNMPIMAFVGRIEPEQKGLDILYEAMEKILPENSFQFILLGTGNEKWEEKYKVLSSKYQAKFKFLAMFDEKLAHQIYAGADMILIPSKFEPCGLPQMIAMRYGTLPLVRKTGGLADTVIDGVNGFVFEEYSGKTLIEKIEKAIKIWGEKEKWGDMVAKAMRTDFSWDKSAKDYLELYNKILQNY